MWGFHVMIFPLISQSGSPRPCADPYCASLHPPPESTQALPWCRVTASVLKQTQLDRIIERSLEDKLPTIWTDETQRWEESEKRREEERRPTRRNFQKKGDPGARKVRKVAKHYVFPMICGSGGSKSRLAKAAGAEPAGQMRDEKLHAVVARSTLPSSKCTKHARVGPHLEVEMSKKCTPLWREAHVQVKMYKAHHARNTFGSFEMFKKCTPLWREAHFEVNSAKNCGIRSAFGRSDVVLRGRRRGLCTLSKVSKTWGFCGSFKNDGRRGTFEEDLERCISRGRRSARDTWGRCDRRSGRRFPERGCILEHQIVSVGKVILRDRCSTS